MFVGAGLVLLGLVVGPMLGIVVDRSVERLALAPEHRCVRCEAPQGPRSLLPVVSWFLRCGTCGRSTGLRYPLVDIATAITFGLLGLRFTDGGDVDPKLVPYLGLAAVLVALSAIDLETHLLPNVIVWPSIAAGLFVVLVVSGELDRGEGIGPALLGGAVFGGFIGAAHVVNERGMGRGDVKLALLLGLFVGWLGADLFSATRLVLYAMLLALVGGAVVGLAVNIARRQLRSEIPFGPALAAGALVVILASPAIERLGT